MTSPFDGSGDEKISGDRIAGQRISPTSFACELHYCQEAEDGDRDFSRADNLPTVILSAVCVDGSPTQSRLEADRQSSAPSYFAMFDGLSLSEQPTWVFPVIPGASKALKPEASTLQATQYIGLIRELVKSSGIYALSSLATPLVSLVLLPYLTSKLSHAEYGALAVLTTGIALVAGVTQLGLSNAFVRAYIWDYESRRDRLGVVSTAVLILLFVSLPLVLTVIMGAPWLANLLFNNSSFSNPVKVAALIVLAQNLTVPGLSWLRSENRAVGYSILSIATLLLNLGGAIVFVGFFHMGITGALLGMAAGYTVIVISTLPVVFIRMGLHLRIDIARNLLSFGAPQIFNFISVWVLQLSDRFLLSRLGSLSQTASYAVAYTLGGVLSVVILSPFSLAWPTAMFAIAKRDDAPQVFRLVFRWFGIVLLLTACGLSFVAVDILNIFFPAAYQSAAPIIPIVTLSMVFFGLYSFFTVGIGVQRKTWYAVIFTTSAALLNVGLNFVLIPHYGSIGAALSTLIAYAVLALLAYIVNQRIYPIPFEIGIFSMAMLVGVAFYVSGNLLAQIHGASIWGIQVSALCLYSGYLLVRGRLPIRIIRKKIYLQFFRRKLEI